MNFDISFKGLTTLKGIEFPPNITELYCNSNRLTTLEGCPPSITTLYCNNNRLTTLEGCPPSVTKLKCCDNQLTTLEGCPPNVTTLDCCGNLLTTLEGCPPNVIKLDCFYNQLTTLEGCPLNVTIIYCHRNMLVDPYKDKSLPEIHNINRIKALKKGISLLNRLISASKIQRFWRKWWYEELDSENISRFIRK